MVLCIYHSTEKLIHQLLTLKEGREIQTQFKKSQPHRLCFESYVAKNTSCFIVTVPKTGLGNHRFKVVSKPYPNSYWSFVSYSMAITDFPCNSKQLLNLCSDKYPRPEWLECIISIPWRSLHQFWKNSPLKVQWPTWNNIIKNSNEKPDTPCEKPSIGLQKIFILSFKIFTCSKKKQHKILFCQVTPFYIPTVYFCLLGLILFWIERH